MKIKGKKASVRKEPVVFERLDGKCVIWLTSVDEYAPFQAQLPMPEPDVKEAPDGTKVRMTKDPAYLRDLKLYEERFGYWLAIQSMSCEENELEWSYIKEDDPGTWAELPQELADYGLSQSEANYLIQMINNVNALSNTYLESARESFLAERRQANQKSD